MTTSVLEEFRLPPTMRAWTHTARGPPARVLQLSTLPTPSLADLLDDEILVKISHAGIFQGVAALMGILPHFTATPWIPCYDFAGTVIATGSSVRHVRPGDAVFGSPDPKKYLRGKYNGSLAEYAVFPATAAVRKPDRVSAASAAGTGGNGCTAIQLCELAELRKGDKVFVSAASGNLGSLTVQVARSVVGREGKVIGSCSAANAELVRGLGVDEVIDYKTENVHEYLKTHHSSSPFDAIIDIAGYDDVFRVCPAYLKSNGVYIHAGNMGLTHNQPSLFGILRFALGSALQSRWPAILSGVPRKNFFYSANINYETLQKVADLIDAGHVTGLVDSEWAMEDGVKAFERVSTARARGKVLVRTHD